MSSGFEISRMTGIRWRAMSRCSRVWKGWRAIIWDGVGPRCVIKKRYREYAAVIRVPVPVRARVQGDQLNMAVIIKSSPIRLGKGGRAKLAKLAINHQTAVRGKIICNPRAKIIVRL